MEAEFITLLDNLDVVRRMLTAMGLTALITGSSAFTAKHVSNKFTTTYYVIATNSINTRYLISELFCPGGSKACSGHIIVLGSTVKTSSSGTPKTWVKKADFTVTGTKD